MSNEGHVMLSYFFLQSSRVSATTSIKELDMIKLWIEMAEAWGK